MLSCVCIFEREAIEWYKGESNLLSTGFCLVPPGNVESIWTYI